MRLGARAGDALPRRQAGKVVGEVVYMDGHNGSRVERSRAPHEKCDGCRRNGGPCTGPICRGCYCCEWQCDCDEGGGRFEPFHELGWCHHCETFQLLSDAPCLIVSYWLELGEDWPRPCCVVCREGEPWELGVWDTVQFVEAFDHCSVCGAGDGEPCRKRTTGEPTAEHKRRFKQSPTYTVEQLRVLCEQQAAGYPGDVVP